jgi:hypothetical protein
MDQPRWVEHRIRCIMVVVLQDGVTLHAEEPRKLLEAIVSISPGMGIVQAARQRGA